MAREPGVVYLLGDPRTGRWRYVGQTTDLQKRVQEHVSFIGRRRARNRKERWLARLAAAGREPVVRVVEQVPAGGDLLAAESRWIGKALGLGWPLTNHTYDRLRGRSYRAPAPGERESPGPKTP